jgi:PAS domain S-box-containing protein
MSVADLPQLRGSTAAINFAPLADLDQAVIDAIPMAVYVCAGDGRVIGFNDRAVQLWGRKPRLNDPEERYCGSLRLYRTDGSLLPHDESAVAVALVTGESFDGQEVVIERPDGERHTVLANIAPLKDEHGRVTGVVNCFQDISARKLAEERQLYIVNELNHRVKNLLATVHSMAAFTARDAASLEDFSQRFEARLVALSRTQALLSQCQHSGAKIRDLLAQQLGPFGAGKTARIRFAGPDVDLQASEAFSLCLAFHELMTNAAKYGALSVGKGRVSVEWDVAADHEGSRILQLRWSETGGPVVSPPTRTGFGTKLIQRTIASLRGEIDLAFEPSGLRFNASIPLAGAGANSADASALQQSAFSYSTSFMP